MSRSESVAQAGTPVLHPTCGALHAAFLSCAGLQSQSHRPHTLGTQVGGLRECCVLSRVCVRACVHLHVRVSVSMHVCKCECISGQSLTGPKRPHCCRHLFDMLSVCCLLVTCFKMIGSEIFLFQPDQQHCLLL
jgi:hypothetical protein